MTIRDERMKNSRASLRLVIERFPEHQPSLESLWEVNSSFQSLCEEYEDCLAALKYWQMSTGEEARKYRDEYAALVPELEAEILEYLESSAKGPIVTEA